MFHLSNLTNRKSWKRRQTIKLTLLCSRWQTVLFEGSYTVTGHISGLKDETVDCSTSYHHCKVTKNMLHCATNRDNWLALNEKLSQLEYEHFQPGLFLFHCEIKVNNSTECNAMMPTFYLVLYYNTCAKIRDWYKVCNQNSLWIYDYLPFDLY